MEQGKARCSADERIKQVVAAAVTVFATSGYSGGRTEDIARVVGVSQSYVIRLFGSKRNVFLAALHHAFDRLEDIIRTNHGPAYRVITAERESLLLLLHGFAAGADPAIGDPVRDRFGRLYQLIRDVSDATAEEARQFMATAMLITVMTALHVNRPDGTYPSWAEEIRWDDNVMRNTVPMSRVRGPV